MAAGLGEAERHHAHFPIPVLVAGKALTSPIRELSIMFTFLSCRLGREVEGRFAPYKSWHAPLQVVESALLPLSYITIHSVTSLRSFLDLLSSLFFPFLLSSHRNHGPVAEPRSLHDASMHPRGVHPPQGPPPELGEDRSMHRL